MAVTPNLSAGHLIYTPSNQVAENSPLLQKLQLDSVPLWIQSTRTAISPTLLLFADLELPSIHLSLHLELVLPFCLYSSTKLYSSTLAPKPNTGSFSGLGLFSYLIPCISVRFPS